jgi:hypothetical protein
MEVGAPQQAWQWVCFHVVKGPLPSRTISFCVQLHCVLHAQTCQLTTSSDAEALRIHAGGPSFTAELSLGWTWSTWSAYI